MAAAAPLCRASDVLRHDAADLQAACLCPEGNCGYLDEIDEVSDPLWRMSYINSLVGLLSMAFKIRYPSPAATNPLDFLVATMSGGLLRDLDDLPLSLGVDKNDVVNSFSRLLSPVLNGLAGLSELEAVVDARANAVEYRRFWSLDGRNLLREANGYGGAKTRRRNSEIDYPFLDKFVQDQTCRVALSRRTGTLVLVPEWSKKGDQLWVKG